MGFGDWLLPGRTLSANQPRFAVVVELEVIFQVLLCCKGFFALGTGERTVSSVLVHVDSQMRFLNKSFVTDGTLMWSLVRMQHHVFGQDTSGHKTFSTLRTDMTLNPVAWIGVHSCNVLCHMCLLGELLQANRAPMGLLTGMGQQMFLKLWGRDADSQTSRMRAGMLCSMISPLVHGKLLQSREPHVTETARERFHIRHWRLKLGSSNCSCRLVFNWYLMLGPVTVMNCSMLSHVRSNRKSLSTDWTHVRFQAIVGPSMHREVGGLGESLSTFITRVGFQTQVNVHVVLQLDSGAKLLVTPGSICLR